MKTFHLVAEFKKPQIQPQVQDEIREQAQCTHVST